MPGQLLSVIVPCFNEADNIIPFHDELTKQVTTSLESYGLSLELLFIDDGSSDDTVSMIRSLREKDPRVKLLSFSRNFGKESAIYAGLEHARGDYTVVMDCDLQDPPALLPEMLHGVLEEGYDSVGTRRVTRKGEPPIRSWFARRFYSLINMLSKTEVVDGARDYRIMNRQFTDAILSLSEYNRFSKGIFGWVGFRTKWLEFENVERIHGETKWSFWKLFVYAMDGITAFSTAPLAFASIMGGIFCILSVILIIVTIIRKIAFGDPTSGWPSLVCIISLISGVQLFCLGIVGQYLSKTYLEVKRRPLYILRKDDLTEGNPPETEKGGKEGS